MLPVLRMANISARTLLAKRFLSILTGHKQARPVEAVLMLTIYYYCSILH